MGGRVWQPSVTRPDPPHVRRVDGKLRALDRLPFVVRFDESRPGGVVVFGVHQRDHARGEVQPLPDYLLAAWIGPGIAPLLRHETIASLRPLPEDDALALVPGGRAVHDRAPTGRHLA